MCGPQGLFMQPKTFSVCVVLDIEQRLLILLLSFYIKKVK